MPINSTAVVQAVGLTKIFRDWWLRPRAVAVDQLDLDIHAHEVFGLLGPNGSGKSTTIKMLLGLLYPTHGRISIFGYPPTDVAVKSRIGYLPEETYLYRFLDARETLDYYGRLFRLPRNERNKRVSQLLDMVGLTREARRKVGEYSKGMQRRLGLAQALINDPDLLILDEPTTGLDPIGTREIKNLILMLNRDKRKTVLMCSHQLGDVEDVCQRLAILYGGRRQTLGETRELLSQQNLTQITTERLTEKTIAQIKALVEDGEQKQVLSVTAPSDDLETFFLRVVGEAQKARQQTSGAVSTGRIAGFLAEGTAAEGTDLVDSLLHAADEPLRRHDEEVVPVGAPSEAPSTEVIEELVTAPARPAAGPAPIEEFPESQPAEDIDHSLIDQLLKDDGRAGESKEQPDMPRSLSYLLVILAGIVAGPFVAAVLWMNPVAAVLGMYAAGVILFLLGVDAVVSLEGVQGFFRDAGEGGRHLATLIISAVASTGLWIVISLLAPHVARSLVGSLLAFGSVSEHVVKSGQVLLIPLYALAGFFAVVAALEFWAARTRWWGRVRAQLVETRGRVGLVLAAAFIAAVIISVIRWEIQLLAIVAIGSGLFVVWVLLDRLMPNSRVWAVARHTVAEALHYKLVVAWVLVMLLLVFALPPVISGDGVTLKSRVQSYLEVTLGIIGGGLGLLTVGLSAYTLPTEIVRKQIFMTVSKPVPRWQLFAGKWAGIGLLNIGLLLFSGAAVWGFTWYLKNEPAAFEDHMALEQEVFKVRQDSKLEKPPNLDAETEQAVRKLREAGELTEDEAAEVLNNRLEANRQNWRSLGPRQGRTYTFKNLRVNPQEQGYLHIRMKPDSASGVDDLKFPVLWAAGDPKDPNTLMPEQRQEIPAKRVTTLIVPAQCVGSDGTLQFHMLNLSSRDTMIFEGDDTLELLYGFGTFHWNLVRALVIIWCRLAFVSAMGLFLSTFLDFPVAFVCTLILFGVSLMSGFLTESLDAARIKPNGIDPIWGPLKLGYVLVPVGEAVVFSLPDFSKYDAAGNVVDGRYVPALWVVHSVVFLVVCWCGAMGALGCWLLTRRELARDGT